MKEHVNIEAYEGWREESTKRGRERKLEMEGT